MHLSNTKYYIILITYCKLIKHKYLQITNNNKGEKMKYLKKIDIKELTKTNLKKEYKQGKEYYKKIKKNKENN